MRTPIEILLFLVKNSKPEYHAYPLSEEGSLDDPEIGYKSHDERLDALLLRCSGTTRYLCSEDSMREFLGAKYVSFEKHLRPLMELGIQFGDVPPPGDFYDTPSYRKSFDRVRGRVCDYHKSNKQSWISFHYGEDNFLKHHKQLVQDATYLGLFKKKQVQKRTNLK